MNNLNDAKSITYKSIDVSFQPNEEEWINFIGTFNFGTLDSLNVSGGPKVLSSIREVKNNYKIEILCDAFLLLLYLVNLYICIFMCRIWIFI